MIPLYRDAVIVAALCAGLLLLNPSARARALAPLLAVGAVAAGLGLGFLVGADLLNLPSWTGLGAEAASLVGWALFGMAARRAPRPWLPGPPALVAWLAGALFGEVAGAALVAAPAKDREQAARLAMAAAAGGLVGRVGDPALLALGERVSPLLLLPLSALLLLLARPRETPEAGGSRAVTAVGLAVAVGAALLPGMAAAPLLVGAVVLLALGWRRAAEPGTWREPLWVLGSVTLALIGAISGLWELLAGSLEWMANDWGAVPLGPLAGLAGLVALFVDGPLAGLGAAAALDRALDLRGPGVGFALAVGAAVGGMGPLVVAGAVKQGFRRWVLGVLLAGVYVALLSGWLQPP